jgi:hypothetical protein
MAKKQHQHFIPKTYLNKFASRVDGDTHFLSALNINTAEVKEISARNLCVESDLYTLKKLGADEKYKIEDFFRTEIENDYNYIYNILTNDEIGFITPDQRIKIIKTLLSLYFRTPKILNEFVDTSIQFLKELKSKNKGVFQFMGIRIDLENDSLNDIKKEIRENSREDFVRTNLMLLTKLMKQRSFDGIVVIKLIGDQEFITSDNPVTITTVGGELLNWFSLKNSIYVPISPKYCVFIAPTSEGAIVNKIYRNHDNFIQHIILNDSTNNNAERWSMGTEKGIKRFLEENEENSKPADENHPIIVQLKSNLSMMVQLTELVESKKYVELKALVAKLSKDESFNKDASFLKIVDQLKTNGII